jgi:endoglucanase
MNLTNWLKILLWGLVTLWLIMLASTANAEWTLFKQRFLLPEGRVIDTAHNNITHSEGQSAVMLLAVHNDDRAVFDNIWQWTRQKLQVREDKLLAWHWSPECGLTDINNATDSDLFVAWALLRAHNKWKNPDYLVDALEIIQDIRKNLLIETKRGIVLLPGMNGFNKSEGIVINLSYWVFPAIQEIASVDPASEWQGLQQTGIKLIKEANFGRWELPADWILLNNKLTLPAEFLPRFSYDAVRIPLYLFWAKYETDELLTPFKQFWGYFNGASFIPAWTNLTDDSIDSYDASPGIRSIAQFSLDYPQLHSVSLPALDKNQDYYSSLLLLLTKAMIQERMP